jgi:hypothetical protein
LSCSRKKTANFSHAKRIGIARGGLFQERAPSLLSLDSSFFYFACLGSTPSVSVVRERSLARGDE